MKEQRKTPEKELKKMVISNLSDAEFKTLVIKMLEELSEDLNSMKKIQSETKDTLIKIKNNLQGNNERVDEAENQINNMEHKKRKKKTPKKWRQAIYQMQSSKHWLKGCSRNLVRTSTS